MKQVDFYLLRDAVNQGRFKLASRLAKKLQTMNQKSLIVLENSSDLRQLDTTLWGFSDTSFVAHDGVSAGMSSLSQTHLAQVSEVNEQVLTSNYDVLINLSVNVPVFCHRFTRIAEIVESDESAKSAGRKRFKHYKTEGFEVKTHDIEL